MTDHLTLREAVASTSLDDLDGLHALFLEASKYTRQARTDVNVALTVRRAEYRFARAIHKAQELGLVASKTSQSGTPLENYMPHGSGYAPTLTRFKKVSEERFEAALTAAREVSGSLSRPAVRAQLELMAEEEPKPVALRVVPTKRGERLINNLAVTASALAAACASMHASEVDGHQFAELVQGARENVGVIRGFLKRIEIDGDDSE